MKKIMRYVFFLALCLSPQMTVADQGDGICQVDTVIGQDTDATQSYVRSNEGDLLMPWDNIISAATMYNQEYAFNSIHWWEVEVDGEGNDCASASSSFTIKIANEVYESIYESTVVVEPVPTSFTTADNKAVYSYEVFLEEDLTLEPASENTAYLLNIRKNADDSCKFAQVTSSADDQHSYSGNEDRGDRISTKGDLSFCLRYYVEPVEEGEEPVEEGEKPVDKGEGEDEGEVQPICCENFYQLSMGNLFVAGLAIIVLLIVIITMGSRGSNISIHF